METELNIVRLTIAIVISYTLLFLAMWLFRKKKSPDEETAKKK